MGKKSAKAALTPEKLKQYEAELLLFFGGDYPEKLLVKGGRITQLRAWMGKHTGNGKPISQGELAIKAGLDVHQSTIQRYETKSTEVPTLHLWAIARACRTSLHEIAYTSTSLPPATSATSIHRAKILIIKSWLTKTLPKDPNVDLKAFVENEWDDPEFNDMISLTKTHRQFLWKSLAQDNWLTENDQGQFFFNEKLRLPPTLAVLIRMCRRVTDLFAETVSIDNAAFGSIQDQLNSVLYPLSEGLRNANAALEDSDIDIDQVLEAIRDCDLAFTIGDQVATNVTLLYHSAFSQWIDAVWAFVVAANDKKAFSVNTMMRPLFQALYKHRYDSFELLATNPQDLARSAELELEFRSFIGKYMVTWDSLRAHLAEIGVLTRPKD